MDESGNMQASAKTVNDQVERATGKNKISLFNKPLNLIDLTTKQELSKVDINNEYECLLCSQKFDLTDENKKNYLAHLLVVHKFVISDVDQIGDFDK